MGITCSLAETNTRPPREPLGQRLATYSWWARLDAPAKEHAIAVAITTLESGWDFGYIVAHRDAEDSLVLSRSKGEVVSPKALVRVSRFAPSEGLNFSRPLQFYRKAVDRQYATHRAYRQKAFWQILLWLSDGKHSS
jgi:hypothetical protein